MPLADAASADDVVRTRILAGAATVLEDLPAASLVEHAVRRGEGSLASNGAFSVRTGVFTGRSPKDKFIVREPGTEQSVWWGAVNQPLEAASFDLLLERVIRHLDGRDVFVQNLFGAADREWRHPIRVITEYAWHSLFARQLLVRSHMFPGDMSVGADRPGWTVIDAPGCLAEPAVDGTRSETFIVLHPGRRMVLIGGTEYAGEIKKSVFTLLNLLLPDAGVLPMHCSANVGPAGDTALFFGLSGTGKTTLSADPSRALIGDDEHGWSDAGVFNFEGGCYAKCIRLSAAAEPQIWSAIKFGTVLENVVIDSCSREPDYDSNAYTENTRAAYPVDYIPGVRLPGVGGHPNNVVFLTADAFGVLPPISRLSIPQARYHFLSGYTAKIAGTERGLGNEPQAAFSACFGEPFLPLPPVIYSRLLGERLDRHSVTVWLVNTGWTGGPFGVGTRMNLAYTRAMVEAAITGSLTGVAYRTDPVFGLSVPTEIPGVPSSVLTPRDTWASPAEYDAQARQLTGLFRTNFDKYRRDADPAVVASEPAG